MSGVEKLKQKIADYKKEYYGWWHRIFPGIKTKLPDISDSGPMIKLKYALILAELKELMRQAFEDPELGNVIRKYDLERIIAEHEQEAE